MSETKQKYAALSWSPEDVQSVRPSWSLEKCEEWLGANEKHLRDRLCELGHEVMEDLMTSDDEIDDDPRPGPEDSHGPRCARRFVGAAECTCGKADRAIEMQERGEDVP